MLNPQKRAGGCPRCKFFSHQKWLSKHGFGDSRPRIGNFYIIAGQALTTEAPVGREQKRQQMGRIWAFGCQGVGWLPTSNFRWVSRFDSLDFCGPISLPLGMVCAFWYFLINIWFLSLRHLYMFLQCSLCIHVNAGCLGDMCSYRNGLNHVLLELFVLTFLFRWVVAYFSWISYPSFASHLLVKIDQ